LRLYWHWSGCWRRRGHGRDVRVPKVAKVAELVVAKVCCGRRGVKVVKVVEPVIGSWGGGGEAVVERIVCGWWGEGVGAKVVNLLGRGGDVRLLGRRCGAVVKRLRRGCGQGRDVLGGGRDVLRGGL
jgi:hypothetical protein